MNTIERMVDQLSPSLSIRLRLLKYQLLGHGALAVLPKLVRPGETVADIGANRGVYTYRLAQLVGTRGHVHAFEPVQSNVRVLTSVFGEDPNVTVHPIALSDHSGYAELHVPVFGGKQIDSLASLVQPRVCHDSMTVRLERLDLIASSLKSSISFIKCDVEGHEISVLIGSKALLRDARPTLLIEIEQRHQSIDIQMTFDFLVDLGYRGYFIDSRRLRPLKEFDTVKHQLSFLQDGFMPYGVPKGYVSDFVFVHPDRLSA